MAVANQYDQGTTVQCVTATPFTQSGVAVDPSVVKFVCQRPDGTIAARYTYGTDSQLVRVSVGKFTVNVTADQGGTWTYRFYSQGSYLASAQQTFYVVPDALI